MNGWTPEMVMRQPASVHARLVQMLKDDDKPSTTNADSETPQFPGLTLNESINDR